MSDLDKVYSRAVELGPSTKIQLRWEGAGDASHAATLLLALQTKNHKGKGGAIFYHAVVNLYEKKTSDIAKQARANLADAHKNAWPDEQTYELAYSVDVARTPNQLGQAAAHMMFVRNLMITDTNTGGASQTHDGSGLLTLHQTALRARSNSLGAKGEIHLGMSGEPGLVDGVGRSRSGTPVDELFIGFDSLNTAADGGGLKLQGGTKRVGGSDYDDSVNVMKNDGSDLGNKRTFYLVYQK